MNTSGFWLVFITIFTGFLSARADEAPPPLPGGVVEMTVSSERTTLDRTARQLVSKVEMRARNAGDRPIFAPLHAVFGFSGENGAAVQGVTMPAALGAPGEGPHGAYYLDLSGLVGDGLAPGAEVGFSFEFVRNQNLLVSYVVVVHGQRNRDPLVVMGGPYAGVEGEEMVFDASGSSDPDGDDLEFRWDFGDGTTGTGASLAHAYLRPGWYTVTLRVADSRGATVSRTSEVMVAPSGEFALARTRTLDGNGHPLGGVTIHQAGPTGATVATSDAVSGFASLGGVPGEHAWRFEKAGYLTVHRAGDLLAGQVGVVPYPWMTRLETARVTLSPLDASEARTLDGNVVLTLPATAFPQGGSVAVTGLHGQSLPLPLPFGWSPLAACHLDLPAEAAEDLPLLLKLPQPVPAGQEMIFVRLHPAEAGSVPGWVVVAAVQGIGDDRCTLPVRQSGSYALVLGDQVQADRPAAGAFLPAAAAPVVAAGLTALGTVDPATATASRDAALVTALATVDFLNDGQPLASGAWFLAEVEETYDLLDGRALRVPDYDATFFAYRSGAVDVASGRARFPLRPRVLFGPDELAEAVLRVGLRAGGSRGAGVVTANGGALSLPGLQINLPAGAVSGPAVAGLRELGVGGLSRFLGGLTAVRAFELELPALAPGSEVGFELRQALEPDAMFVLARCVGLGAESGLQPVLRLATDAAGMLASLEPESGDRLPGIHGSGQYVLVRVDAPLALVSGNARDASEAAVVGAVVRVVGTPWLAISGDGGVFDLLAAPGTASLHALHPPTLHSGQAEAVLADAAAVAVVDIIIGPRGPQVLAISPADGADRVRPVEPVVVTFSMPVLPGTLTAPGGLELRAAGDGTLVPGSLILARGNREVRFLPANPLHHATAYTLTLAATIEGVLGLPIEGPRAFGFTTMPPENRGLGGQLVIFEPDADKVPAEILAQLVGYEPAQNRSMVVAHGSPGTADPQVPVILVNETTGRTSTVLSKADGSFANFVPADEEDSVSALFVNANGTRVTVPASRQLFDDGRVGLYNGGGILEAESDGGPVQVIVQPGSIGGRAVFTVDDVPLAELLALLGDTRPPGDAAVLAGLRVVAEGDAPSEPVKVRYPMAAGELDLPAGVQPEEVGHVLTAVREIDGNTVFEVLDDVAWRDGHLETNSPPFVGLLASALETTVAMVRVGYGRYTTVSGRAVSFGTGPNPLGGTPVEGALVFVSGQALVDASGQLNKGALVSVTNSEGHFALLVPETLKEELGFALLGLHPRMPGAIGRGTAVVPDGPFPGRVTGQVNFQRQDSVASPDRSAPVIAVGQSPVDARAGQLVVVEALATDDRNVPSLDLSVVGAVPLGTPPVAVFPDDITVVRQSDTLTPTTRRVVFHVRCTKPASVQVRLQSSDGAFNMATSYAMIQFVADAPPPPVVPNPGDRRGPFVVNTTPSAGALLPLYSPVEVEFNEALDPAFMAQAKSVFMLMPDAGDPQVELSSDQRRVKLFFPRLISGATYNLFVTAGPNGVLRDLAGNPFRQGAVGIPDFYDFRVAVAPLLYDSGLTVENGVGAAGDGEVVFLLDRLNGNVAGRVMVWGRDSGGRAVARAAIDTGVFPRDLIHIKGYHYPRPNRGPAWDRDLLVVVGGKIGVPGATGEAGGGIPWIRVFDVTDPAVPESLVSTDVPSSLTRSLVKLDWSPPMLGVLELGGDGAGVNLVNLPLMIWTSLLGSSRGDEPPNGHPGLDVNGDGDYVDDGDLPPRPSGALPTFGWINGGWVGRAEPPPGDLRNIEDSGIIQGGQLVAAVVRGNADQPSAFRTLQAAGQPVGEGQGELSLPAVPRRLLMLPGVPLQTSGGLQLRNLALITFSGQPVIRVIDVTNPLAPVSLGEVTLPLAPGDSLHTMVAAEDHRVVVASGRDLHVLDATKLLLVPGAPGAVPSWIGFIPGAGVPGRRFVADGTGFFAIASGRLVRVATSNPLDTRLEVADVELSHERVVSMGQLLGDRVQVRRSAAGVLEIASDDPHEIKGSAVITPAGVPVPENFPNWTVMTSAGEATRRGRNVTFDSPAYEHPLMQVVDQLDGSSNKAVKLGAFLVLATVPPNIHAQVCEGGSATLRVYPSKEVSGEFTSEELKLRQNRAAEGIVAFLNRTTSSTVSFDVEISGKLKYSAAWQECPHSHRVIYGFEVVSEFDPLLGVEAKVPLTAPQIAWLARMIGGTSYLKLNTGIGLAGFGRRSVDDGVCGSFSGPGMRASGTASATVGFEINNRLLSAEVSASGGFTVSGYMTPAVPEHAFTVRDFKLETSGITATARLQTLAGRIFRNGVERSFALVDPATIYQFDWEFHEPPAP